MEKQQAGSGENEGSVGSRGGGNPIQGVMDQIHPLQRIAEGKEQVVAIDNKTMLEMVMQALGAREMPIFTEIPCGQQGIKVSIKLDVSCAKCSVGETIQTVLVEGEPNKSKVVAGKSAVMKAIKHLNETNLIKVLDYSSRVVHGIEGSSLFGHVNSALYSVEKLIAQWEITLGECRDLAVKLEGKDASDDVEFDYERCDRYGSLNEYMAALVEAFASKVTEAKSKATELEFICQKYQNRSKERYHAEMRKGYMQDAVVQPKVILDYVLGYLGASKAHYTNTPSKYGMTKGVAHFTIPRERKIEYSGNIEIKGTGMHPEMAEQQAAFNALLYMEDKYKIKIVDLNHSERVTAGGEHKLLVGILEQVLSVGNHIKLNWGNMVDSINEERKSYKTAPVDMHPGEGPYTLKKREAYTFCAEEIGRLADDTTKKYDVCAARFEELLKLAYKLPSLESEIEG